MIGKLKEVPVLVDKNLKQETPVIAIAIQEELFEKMVLKYARS